MKRDWDLLREQLLAIEEDKDFKTVILGEIADEPRWLDGQPEVDYIQIMTKYQKAESRIFGHLEMLVDNGYVEGLFLSRSAGGSSFSYGLADPRLTMAGHDLLDTMRSAPLWEKIKTTAKTKGVELTFDTIKGLAGFALKSLLSG
ncbi:DUF2513 domain-containing protein [Variovorax ginsengisoli]|uniref:DUF2513 domain-containing protein n=1 Tax=Variovorax ginsengisoli TaxID=363844 RepID=A0ABT9SDD2_9BURK|nr:DUF2513 domain-containing protein [Variovorax ginsengisoli]MDP9902363.1 hypothetical protein [Variovorax ginsengisoli]